MHLHKPKPIHNWRELATEVGVIVIGILIALGLEQAIETYHERERATVAREAIESELRFSLAKATLMIEMQECSERQIAVLSEAIGRGDQAEVQRLVEALQLPIMEAWSDAAWQTVLVSDVMDQFSERERGGYSILYDIVNSIERRQDLYKTAYDKLRSLSLSGLARSPDVRSAQAAEMAAMTAALNSLHEAAVVYPIVAKNALGIEPMNASEFARLPNANQPAKCRQAAVAMRRPSVPGR